MGVAPVSLPAGMEEIGGVELAAAVVALVAAGEFISAVGTGPLDVAVGEKLLRGGVEGQRLGRGVEIPRLQQAQEEVVDHRLVVLRARAGEEIEGDADSLPGLQELGVKAVDDLLRTAALLLRPHGDGGAVGVGAGDHDHPVPLGAVVAGEDVGGEVGPPPAGRDAESRWHKARPRPRGWSRSHAGPVSWRRRPWLAGRGGGAFFPANLSNPLGFRPSLGAPARRLRARGRIPPCATVPSGPRRPRPPGRVDGPPPAPPGAPG